MLQLLANTPKAYLTLEGWVGCNQCYKLQCSLLVLVQPMKNGLCILYLINISFILKLTTEFFILPEVGCCKRTGLGVFKSSPRTILRFELTEACAASQGYLSLTVTFL